MSQCLETVSAVEGGSHMVYEPPAVRYRGAFNDVLRRLFPRPRTERPSTDRRIMSFYISSTAHEGSVGWDLDRACRELRLDIFRCVCRRLFKRCTGLGVREYSKKKRLLMAAERLTTTDIPIKRSLQNRIPVASAFHSEI